MPVAYQDENGKWYKQCITKQVFGPVDNKEDLFEWFHKNKSKSDGLASQCKEAGRRYRKENPDKRREYKKQYRKENPDKIREIDKKYKQTAAGLFSKYKRRAKQRGINFTLTLQWFEEQMTKPEFNFCAISGINFVVSSNRNEPFARSLDRISSTKGYASDNVRWVCFSHNCWKSDLTLDDMARIFKYTAQSHNLDPVEILNQVS